MDKRNERLIGYARVSTTDQELTLQTDALLAHGVAKEHLFFDKVSGRGQIGQAWRLAPMSFDVATCLSFGGWTVLDGRCDIA